MRNPFEQTRALQDEEAELRKRTRAEHQRLRAVEAELRDREAESQELCTTVHMATRRYACARHVIPKQNVQ